MKAIATRAPRESQHHELMRRLLQIDACAGLVAWLRSIGETVEPYDRRLHDWDDDDRRAR